MGTLQYVVEFVAGTALRFAPLFFLSIGLAAIVRSLPIAQVASRWLAQREHGSVVAGSALGTFSPFCSCTVIPVVRSLLVAGAPLAGVMAFWIASPLMDPEIFVLSVGLLGWDIAIARVVAALVLALVAGYGAVLALRRGWLPDAVLETAGAVPAEVPGERVLVAVGTDAVGTAASDVVSDLPSDVAADVLPVADERPVAAGTCCDEPVPATPAGGCDGGACSTDLLEGPADAPRGIGATLRSLDWRQVRADFRAESWNIGRWILLAFALEALILRFVPQEAMVAVLGSDAPWAVPLAALLGIPLYMDSFSALPVISGLLEQGMAPGAAIAFLLAGPVTTIPAMSAVRAIMPGPVFRYYLAVSLLGSMLLGAVANLVL